MCSSAWRGELRGDSEAWRAYGAVRVDDVMFLGDVLAVRLETPDHQCWRSVGCRWAGTTRNTLPVGKQENTNCHVTDRLDTAPKLDYRMLLRFSNRIRTILKGDMEQDLVMLTWGWSTGRYNT